LKAIGAHHVADIVAKANSRFGPDGPSRSGTARQAQLFLIAPRNSDSDPWETLDRAFYEYPDDIAALLKAFLRARGRLTG
jgi:hypothetical protein